MTTYSSSHQLKGKTLVKDDVVSFGPFNYEVGDNYLSGKKVSNDFVFLLLGIKNKYAFCSRTYSYSTSNGIWPYSRRGDFKVLTKLVMQLMEMFEEKSNEIFSPSLKKSFEEFQSLVKERNLRGYSQCLSKYFLTEKDVREHLIPIERNPSIQDIELPIWENSVFIFSKSKKKYTEEIMGFGGKCKGKKDIFAFFPNLLPKKFIKVPVGDPYHIYMGFWGAISGKKDNLFVFETKGGSLFVF